MSYLTDKITQERWVWIFGLISGLAVGYGAGVFDVALGGPAYKVGYADGRGQAHYDLANFCLEYTQCEARWTGQELEDGE